MSNQNGKPDPEPDREALNALSEKLDALKKSKDVTIDEGNTGMAVGLKYASEFSAAILVGAALGYGADRLFGTAPFGLLVGLILGLIAGVRNIIRSAKEGMETGTDMSGSKMGDGQ